MVDQSPRLDLLRDPPLSKYCGNRQIAIVPVRSPRSEITPKEGFQKSVSSCQLAAGIAKLPFLLAFSQLQGSQMSFANVFCNPSVRGAMSRYREIKDATAEVVGIRLVTKPSTVKAHAAIRDFIIENPTLSYQRIADLLGCSRWLIYTVAVEFNVRRPRGAGSPVRLKEE